MTNMLFLSESQQCNLVQEKQKPYNMKSFLKKTFNAVYTLSPIAILLSVSIMAGSNKNETGKQNNEEQENNITNENVSTDYQKKSDTYSIVNL